MSHVRHTCWCLVCWAPQEHDVLENHELQCRNCKTTRLVSYGGSFQSLLGQDVPGMQDLATADDPLFPPEAA